MRIKVLQEARFDGVVYPVGEYDVPDWKGSQMIASGIVTRIGDSVEPVELPEHILEKLDEAGVEIEDAKEMELEDLMKLEGIGKASAEKILNS